MCQLAAGRWPWSTGDRVDNTWPVAALTAGSKAIVYRLRIAIFAYHTCIRRPRLGGSLQNIAMPFGTEKLGWCDYQVVQKFRRYFNSFWQNVRTWRTQRHTDTHTQAHTEWRHRPRLQSIARQKNKVGISIISKTQISLDELQVPLNPQNFLETSPLCSFVQSFLKTSPRQVVNISQISVAHLFKRSFGEVRVMEFGLYTQQLNKLHTESYGTKLHWNEKYMPNRTTQKQMEN